ncbi:6-phosphogluconate dehydrogenase C-terminal domain-like protein [Hypoxylon rubiginosum]|uniref:6-phosphogluconate dehydrogenase C-terminal domain-like protein n=1 Tax=Hypoxylon rubiginosum TaxID=110542 RepID=A0ACC0DI04_9PEZI|nr:6-phosphogluconate dehydrogenase C-terminal domain-like protein [Hypoxylon rubiginosum]
MQPGTMNFSRWIRIIGTITHSSKPSLSPSSFSSRFISSRASSRQVPAEWLRRILQDRADPPRLYAWTPANLLDYANADPSDAEKSPAPSEIRLRKRDDDERRRIYILGLGNLGRLYATFLAKNPNRPPITLVVHRRELLEHWMARPGVELVRAGVPETNADFDVEWWTETKPTDGPIREPAAGGAIPNLVVATKAADALPQVDRLRRYLDGASTVAFTQNGMCKLWPPLGDAYVQARFPEQEQDGEDGKGGVPDWLVCVTTHGVTSLGPFRSVHASPAGVLVGNVVARGMGKSEGNRPSDYLAAQIIGAPGLDARRVDTRELWVAQLEKLVVNSTINPLTAVLRCKNGELFAERGDEDRVPAVIDVLLEEASRTLRALVAHPSSDSILQDQRSDDEGDTQEAKARESEALERVRDELSERFSFARLRQMLYGVAAKVAENTSSMLQDVRAGKPTEIADFNGWLVETARYVGDEDCRVPAHEKLVKLVEDGKVLTREELSREFLGSKKG